MNVKKINEDSVQSTGVLQLDIPEEEVSFAKELLRKTLLNYDKHNELIKSKLQNWDLDRVAEMDILIIKMALNEAETFVSIPLLVTLDEYIELSKFYSTEKSSTFVNGILDTLLNHLSENNIIKKAKIINNNEK
ncbi:MAG: transcription antitermination protein NusB [Endomicrobiia bacterium]